MTLLLQHYVVSLHARQRLATRCGLIDVDKEFLDVRNIYASTHSIKKVRHHAGVNDLRLFFMKEIRRFCVLVTTHSGDEKSGYFCDVMTALTVGMFESTYGSVREEAFCAAVFKRLGENGYRAWAKDVLGLVPSIGTRRLHVIYKPDRRNIEMRVRKFCCEGFKNNEPLRNTLAHPGVLTHVHETLAQRGLRVEDRTFMFFSYFGQIRMEKKVAETCPYCGMEPLATDLPATKRNDHPDVEGVAFDEETVDEQPSGAASNPSSFGGL